MATPPQFGDDDYQGAMLALLPQGRVWQRELTSVLARMLGALSPTYTRSSDAATQLLVDMDPTLTVNLLPEWEKSLGLPDACTPANPSFSQRQAAVRAKWAARGGQTTAYYIHLALLLGYPGVSIQQYAPSRFGGLFGEPFGGDAWAFAWLVSIPGLLVTDLLFGQPFGQFFATWGSTEIQCRIEHAAPAHTIVLFTLGADKPGPPTSLTVGLFPPVLTAFLAWTAPAMPPEVWGYYIWSRPTGTLPWTYVTSTPIAPAIHLPVNVADFSAHDWKVTAFNGAGESLDSNIVLNVT
jgi:uncharacterized protein YmfQ (DUF2313 family)